MRLPIADAHCHYWTPRTHKWLQDAQRPFSREYLPASHLKDLDLAWTKDLDLDLRETVYIQANMHAAGEFTAQEEVAWLDGMAAACGRPNAVIGYAPLHRPKEAAAIMDACRRYQTYRGVRFMLDYHPERPELCQTDRGDYMSDPAFLEGLRLLGPRSLVFELQVCQCQLAEAAELASLVPEVTLLLNHAGFPLRGEHSAWREGMACLAAQPNVGCKLGAFGACDDEPFTTEETRRYVGDCLELFGVERCMFASNLPVDLATATPRQRWADLWTSVHDRGLAKQELEALFRGNCLRYYGIDAVKPTARRALPRRPSPAALASSAPPLHTKARQLHSLYTSRTIVPDEKVSWRAPWPAYEPVAFTTEKVLANDVTINPDGWADPADPRALDTWEARHSYEGELLFDARMRPRNPRGRTGMADRGLLGKWGPNFAADPIVTRWVPRGKGAAEGRSTDGDEGEPQLQVVVIQRADTGEWALPGGMVDTGETISGACSPASSPQAPPTSSPVLSSARQISCAPA